MRMVDRLSTDRPSSSTNRYGQSRLTGHATYRHRDWKIAGCDIRRHPRVHLKDARD